MDNVLGLQAHRLRTLQARAVRQNIGTVASCLHVFVVQLPVSDRSIGKLWTWLAFFWGSHCSLGDFAAPPCCADKLRNDPLQHIHKDWSGPVTATQQRPFRLRTGQRNGTRF